MTHPWQRRVGMVSLFGLLLLPVFSGGCRKAEDSSKDIPLKGKVEKIDRTSDQSGTLSVLYYNEKQGKDVVGTAIVTAETEIMISGALGKFSDLRVGDRVRGMVRVEKKGGVKTLTILKIRVMRKKPPSEGG